MTLNQKEIIDVIRDYQFELECVMDACPNIDSHIYKKASSQWLGLSNLIDRIYNAEKEKAINEYYSHQD